MARGHPGLCSQEAVDLRCSVVDTSRPMEEKGTQGPFALNSHTDQKVLKYRCILKPWVPPTTQPDPTAPQMPAQPEGVGMPVPRLPPQKQ